MSSSLKFYFIMFSSLKAFFWEEKLMMGKWSTSFRFITHMTIALNTTNDVLWVCQWNWLKISGQKELKSQSHCNLSTLTDDINLQSGLERNEPQPHFFISQAKVNPNTESTLWHLLPASNDLMWMPKMKPYMTSRLR